MSLNELLVTMQNEMYSATEEIEKFINGNKSAGTRVRKSMQNIKTVAQNVRQEVQEMKNNS
jgi:hypothetical protein|tara:strand:- start:647 stop:829 length:183 start_codon:yes stop_codon:yes gene_type:complete